MNTYLIKRNFLKFRVDIFLFFLLFLSSGCSQLSSLPYSSIKPQSIELDLPAEDEGIGGLITSDVNDDGQKDLIVTKPGHLVVYQGNGQKLWAKQIDIQVAKKSEKNGLPGWHGPGVQAGDVDGDSKTEVLFLTKDNTLHIVEGESGKTKKTITLKSPAGTERWEHLVITNFRGQGDRDLLLQTTNSEGYRTGVFLAAYAIDDLLKKEDPQPLWTRDDFVASAHNGARVADLNADGKDEVLGGTLISPDGEILIQISLKGHIDAIFVADVRPDIPGLEVVALEEGGGNRVFLFNSDRLIWETDYKNKEPQNGAIGDFDPNRPGLEIWSRSRYPEHQKPFVFDAQGQLIAKYKMDNVAPRDWTVKGVEVIFTIDWIGEEKQLAAAKERHESGDVAIFDPLTGKFLHRFKEKADRLYVADVSGDWREELIVLNGNQLHIYSNPEPNPNPNRPRLWSQNHYRRSKMTWNYYSP
ncbi:MULTISPECIES: FG-GAP-like repeat-containing protein [unclassified Okeania]|uniref:rhamnogalacturonan lyase family protein n=1 Tax=unclassified Okeania TaxID=2634635 RepID=UPI0013BB67A3|nr:MULTISPECIES: FG-GAP-like repeat-containing protein [unclassified Okeania]NES78364.1 hypothetical protein [Okeania sp. SIO1H4]NET12318.1 hypothetical protein [Okeania sp. SIO1H6]NET21703.1 hypothetical protein [Okeania sp. SIO1H5]NET95052.1 hypothetical protein [Okeania sp. SIO1H2]